MLLTFQQQFILPIMRGIKIQTIRKDKHNRWKVGARADMWCRNPRNTHLNPFKFGISIVELIQSIEIFPNNNLIHLPSIEAIYKDKDELDALAINDGFSSWEEMKKFFPKTFIGKLIYWNPKIQFVKTIEEVEAINSKKEDIK